MVQEVGHLAPSAVEVDVVRVGLGHVRQPSEETNGTAVDTPEDLRDEEQQLVALHMEAVVVQALVRPTFTWATPT